MPPSLLFILFLLPHCIFTLALDITHVCLRYMVKLTCCVPLHSACLGNWPPWDYLNTSDRGKSSRIELHVPVSENHRHEHLEGLM